MLEELYTRDGAGTQIIRESYEQIRPANPGDVPGIIELISPLEEQGVLVKRSRELLESEHHLFTVCERDGMIVGCAALYPFDNIGELACLATHPDYRDDNRGELLLAEIVAKAKKQKFKTLFVLQLERYTGFWSADSTQNLLMYYLNPESHFTTINAIQNYLQKR